MRVYIANLGKYNEGELVGDWFSFPIDEEDVAERIGLNSYYEEYAVHDTDNFPIEIGEYISIQELNEMYDMICELPDYITDALDEFVSHYGSLEEVYEHKDEIYYYPNCEDMTDVAYYFIDELQVLGQIPLPLQNYIDYEAYGRDLSIEGTFIETSRAVILLGDLPPLSLIEGAFLKYFGIPVALTWFMSQKTFDGKKPYSFLKSQITFALRPKVTYAGKAVKLEKEVFSEPVTVVRSVMYVPD